MHKQRTRPTKDSRDKSHTEKTSGSRPKHVEEFFRAREFVAQAEDEYGSICAVVKAIAQNGNIENPSLPDLFPGTLDGPHKQHVFQV